MYDDTDATNGETDPTDGRTSDRATETGREISETAGDDGETGAGALRVRAALDRWFVPVFVVLLATAAVGGALTHTAHVDPGTEQRERTAGSWTVTAEYDHGAVVTESNSLFETGTELADRRTYFRRVAPVLDATVSASYAAERAENVTVSLRSRLVLAATTGTDRADGAAEGRRDLWSQSERLGETTETDVASGESVSQTVAVNASEVAQRFERISDELGAIPGEENATVETDVVVSGTIDGEPVEYTRTVVLDLELQSDAYTVVERGVGADQRERTEFVAVEREYGPLRTVGGPALLVAGLGLAGGLVAARRRGRIALSDPESERLAYLDDRAEFDAWIVRMRPPDAAFDRPAATAESLADLVDYAIDTDAGVLEDPRTGAYHVLGDTYRYTYEPPSVDPPAEGSRSPTGEGAESSRDDGVSADDDPLDADASDWDGHEPPAAGGVDASAENGSRRPAAENGTEPSAEND